MMTMPAADPSRVIKYLQDQIGELSAHLAIAKAVIDQQAEQLVGYEEAEQAVEEPDPPAD